MNREQAWHILDAYIGMECNGGDNKARQSLRDVILDAMTQYKASTITVPNITYPSYPKVSYTDNSKNLDGTTRVTCSGIDPAFNTNIASMVDGTATIAGYQDGVVKAVVS